MRQRSAPAKRLHDAEVNDHALRTQSFLRPLLQLAAISQSSPPASRAQAFNIVAVDRGAVQEVLAFEGARRAAARTSSHDQPRTASKDNLSKVL